MDWQPGVEDYSGPAIEVDFFRLRSFTMAHVTDAGILQALKDQLQQTLEGGGTFRDFRDKAVELLGAAADDEHLRTVYQTNLHTAYNAGKYYEGMDAIAELPYFIYRTVGDDNVRPAHKLLANRAWGKGDPIWNIIWPPNGFNCRCSPDEADDDMLREEGIRPESGGLKFDEQPDPGFDQNAAADPAILEQLAAQWQMAERLWEQYQLEALTPKAAAETKTELAQQITDGEGLLRNIPVGLAAQYGPDAMIVEMTLRDPMEIWGWPGKNLFYIATYETVGGIKAVVVEVWGDVQQIHIVNGSADAFRKGMLLKKT